MKNIITLLIILFHVLLSPAQENPTPSTNPSSAGTPLPLADSSNVPSQPTPATETPSVQSTTKSDSINPVSNKTFKKLTKQKKEAITTIETLKSQADFNSGADKEDKKYDFLNNIEYPELQVVPRASERLYTEALAEDDLPFLMYWPMEISAVFTLYAGIVSKGTYKESLPTETQKNNSDSASMIAQSTGAAWLGLSLFLAYKKPYVDAYNRIKKMKTNNKRAEIFKERIAEEEMERIHNLSVKLNWLSALTQGLVNAALLDRTSPANEKWAAAALATSVLPLLFETRYITNWQKHQEYKRKIYAPVASMTVTSDKGAGSYYPQFNLTWNF